MSLKTPTTKDINDTIIAQLEASLNQKIPLLPKSFLRVLAKVLAAVFILLYKYAGFTFLQMFVQTASDKETDVNGITLTPLVQWGRLIGIGDPTPATQAELTITVDVHTMGATLAAGSQLIGADNGVTYVTQYATLLNHTSMSIDVRAVADQTNSGGRGSVGNLPAGSSLSFANPLAIVAREAVVYSIKSPGANGESTAAYRQRIIDRFQRRPQGGAYADYAQWGEEVAGILHVYPYTGTCPGQVDVYVEATAASSGNVDGIPTNAQLQAVLDSIFLDQNGLNSRRPANALVNAFPITRVPFTVDVVGLVVDNTTQVMADITTIVEDYFSTRAPFIVGLSVLPRRDRVTSSELGGVVSRVVNSAGGVFDKAVLKSANVDITTKTLGIGEKAKVTAVTFI